MIPANDLARVVEARIGAVVGDRWHVDRLLGTGGMSAVYEAHHHRNEHRVALKILHPSLTGLPDHVARFLREGYAANQIAHPGVVRVYDDVVDGDGSAALVMELLDGSTLAQLAKARGGTLPPKDVLGIAFDVLDVLVAAHAVSILHRDIKPENLFRTASGTLKVLDFGIARLVDSASDSTATEPGVLLGTPAYVAPEQAMGLVERVDHRTDLWAVGATMFTLLSGRFVHEASTPNEQLGKAMVLPAPSLRSRRPDLPDALVHVVDRALAFACEDRWATARDMQQAVRWILDHWEELESKPDLVPETWAALESSDVGRVWSRAGTIFPRPRFQRLRRWGLPLSVGLLSGLALELPRLLRYLDTPSASGVVHLGNAGNVGVATSVEMPVTAVPFRNEAPGPSSASEPPARDSTDAGPSRPPRRSPGLGSIAPVHGAKTPRAGQRLPPDSVEPPENRPAFPLPSVSPFDQRL